MNNKYIVTLKNGEYIEIWADEWVETNDMEWLIFRKNGKETVRIVTDDVSIIETKE